MSPFTPEAAARLDAPAAGRAARVAAAERFVATGLPSAKEEIWRYSRIAELDLGAYHLADGPVVAPAPSALPATVAAVARPAGVLMTVNGRFAGGGIDPALGALGVVAGVLDGPDAMGSVMTTPADCFCDLNAAFAAAPLEVRAPAGVSLPGPVVVVHWVDEAGVAAFPRLVVTAGAASDVTVVEVFASADVHALVVPVAEVEAGPAARVRYLGLQHLGPSVWSIASQACRGERDSSTVWSYVALGGDYARVRLDATLAGPGAHGEQVAVYFGEGTQTHDFRSLQDHLAPRTTSNLLFKGAVEGHAHSVYSGLIHVGKDARGANAFQTNRNLKLSDGAWAESVPNLDIETNDVRCSHASAVGPIDEAQRFYLESRGVPPTVAERLIVLGFFDEVLGSLPVPDVVPALRAEIAAKLDRRGES